MLSILTGEPDHQRSRKLITSKRALYLHALPTELLSLIFEHFNPDQLCKLSLGCRVLHTAVQQSLYRSIKLFVDERGSVPDFYLLLWTLLRHRHLASYIRAVEIVGYVQDRSLNVFKTYEKHSRHTRTARWNDFIRLARRYLENQDEVLDLDNWLKGIDNEETATQAALLLSLTSGLQTLRLPHGLDMYPLDSVIRYDSYQQESQRRLTSLKCVEFMHHDDARFYVSDRKKRASLAVTLLCLGNLEKLIGGLTHGGFCPSSHFQFASKLRILHLKHSQDYDQNLSTLLQRTPVLEELVLRLAPEVDRATALEDVAFESEHLVKALTHLSPSLRTFRLHIFKISVVWHEINRRKQNHIPVAAPSAPLPSTGIGVKDILFNFQRLETLEIPILALFGRSLPEPIDLSRVLPPNLKSFLLNDECIRGFAAPSHTMASLMKLFEDQHINGPMLEDYTLLIRRANMHWDFRAHDPVVRACSAAAVKFKLIPR